MHSLLTTSLALAIVALPSTSAVSLARGSQVDASAKLAEARVVVASALIPGPRPSLRSVETETEPAGSAVSIVPVLLHDANSKENRIFLVTDEGELVGDDPRALDDFFRCRRSGRRHRMAPQIVSVLADISAAYPGHVIEVVSGFRKRGFGVKDSKHFRGRAIDLRVRGVKTSELRDFLWAGKEEARGVGHYRHENFVHVDHRPNEQKVGWTQRRRNSAYQYNPKWARPAAVDVASL